MEELKDIKYIQMDILNFGNNDSNTTKYTEELKQGNNESPLSDVLSSLNTMIFYICLFSFNSINISIAGHKLSNKSINAIGISNLYVNCLILSWTVGIFSGFETLGPNAYAMKNFHQFGLYFHRAQIIGNIFMLFLLIINCSLSKYLFSFIINDGETNLLAERYIYLLFIAVFFDCQFSLNFKYLNIIGKSYIGSITIFLCLVIHCLLSYLFVNVYNLEIEGLGYSLIITNIINTLIGCIYIYIYKPVPMSIFWFYRNSFLGLDEYLKISIPSTLIICSQWIAYEILSLIVFWIGNLDYTVHVIMYSLWMNSTVITHAFSITAIIVIGKEIILGDIEKLKMSVFSLYKIGISFMGMLSLIYIFGGNIILNIFTNDKEVIDKGRTVLIVVSVMILIDFTQLFMNSVNRGLNKFCFSLFISISNYYILQVCLVILFGKIISLGVLGVWIGISLSSIITTIIYINYFQKLDLIEIRNNIISHRKN